MNRNIEKNNDKIEEQRKLTQRLVADLSSFTCTTCHHRHWLGVGFTDGVKYLADEAGAHWLIDAIASWQPEAQKIDREFQVWELVVNPDQSAVLSFRTDAGQPVSIRQTIPYTDFPLESIEIWVEDEVLLLPSEH